MQRRKSQLPVNVRGPAGKFFGAGQNKVSRRHSAQQLGAKIITVDGHFPEDNCFSCRAVIVIVAIIVQELREAQNEGTIMKHCRDY